MKNSIVVLFLLPFLLLVFACNKDHGSLIELNYSPDEIFPIKIDKYGFPNVKMDYLKDPVWIVWDTGNMTGLVLSKKVIEHNNLTVKDSIRLRDAGGTSVGYSHRYITDSVAIFDNVYHKMLASTAIGDHDGLIGPRFMDLNRFTIDYGKKLMGVSKNVLADDKIKGEVLPMVKAEALPRLIVVEGEVNGKKVLIEIDTGKSRTVVDPELVKEQDLISGEQGVIIKNLALGEITVQITNGKLKSFKGISKTLPQPIRVGIGSDLLKGFIVTVDYSKGIVLLKSVEN